MSVLKASIKDGTLHYHYQRGMLRLLELPTEYAKAHFEKSEFFAYISTLGGGMVKGDNYLQDFKFENSKAILSSQSNQKIYKGSSNLTTKISLDESSKLVFHNDANIFYKNSDFSSKTTIFVKNGGKFFYLDGGFIGYSGGEFTSNLTLRIYIDSKLALNDNFCYENKRDLNALFEYEYFYTITMSYAPTLQSISTNDIKAYASSINGITMVRIIANDNDIANDYINEIKFNFLKENR